MRCTGAANAGIAVDGLPVGPTALEPNAADAWLAPRTGQSSSSEARSRIAAHQRVAMAMNMVSERSVGSAVA